MGKNKPKRNHHILPKLYLKGFVEKEGAPFIWVYERGKGYNPGHIRQKNNPYKDSISVAGARRDYYAYKTRAGKVDFETYENILETLEKPADPVFRKIRGQQIIDSAEKGIFASYMVQMIRRVPRRREMMKELWPKTLEEYESSSELIGWINKEEASTPSNDIEKLSKLLKLREEAQRIINEYRDKIPDEIALGTMVSKSRLIPVIASMTWQFLIAPEGRAFITGDNPVFYFESFGLNKPFSEVTFPISKSIALAASWHKELPEGFLAATSETVSEINRRTASVATSYVYHSCNASWIVDVLNKKKHRYSLLYPHSEENG